MLNHIQSMMETNVTFILIFLFSWSLSLSSLSQVSLHSTVSASLGVLIGDLDGLFAGVVIGLNYDSLVAMVGWFVGAYIYEYDFKLHICVDRL